MELDQDLSAIQEARDMIRKAKAAQQVLAQVSAEEIDRLLRAMVEAVEANVDWLSKLAVDETKYGVYEHKIIKNLFASRDVYNYIKNLKTTGIVNEDIERKVMEIAVPMGVVMGIVPTTNPTSTLIHNSLCAIKSGNAIVFSPHPNAVRCTTAAARIVHDAAVKAGAPEGIIGCISQVNLKVVEEMMHHNDIAVIVATGGSGMVKAAYSAGKPALGVGPGNVPAFVERTADLKKAARDIVNSKSFDNGMICASEQAIIADEPIKEKLIAELQANGAYFLNKDEVQQVSRVVMTSSGGMVPALVGKAPRVIAEKAGIRVPEGTKVLVAPLEGYGPEYPLSYEKLTTVLAFYTVKDWKEGCHLSIELLKLGGIGHSTAIHSQNEEIIRAFIQKPVFRILVNTPSALGGVGYTTGLKPSMTLGSGTWGGSSLSDNLDPRDLINIKRLAYGIKDYEPPVQGAAAVLDRPPSGKAVSEKPAAKREASFDAGAEEIAVIVQQVLERLAKAGC